MLASEPVTKHYQRKILRDYIGDFIRKTTYCAMRHSSYFAVMFITSSATEADF